MQSLRLTTASSMLRASFRRPLRLNLIRSFAAQPFKGADERAAAIRSLGGQWTEVAGRDAIFRSFQFDDFSEAWSWMSRVALAAERADHHPEWFNVYSRVDVTLATHDVNGVSWKDIELARKMNRFAS